MNFTKNKKTKIKTNTQRKSNTQRNKTNENSNNISNNISSKDSKEYDELPFVSVCTPTFNRRPFVPFLIDCFINQDYPIEKMEWIIVDDGDDKIEDLVSNIPQVKYFKSQKKIALGRKRNIMNSKCQGDIIVYMDDDDYYPPERVSHAVETLMNNSLYDVAGCDDISIYFGDPECKIYDIGPYHEYHATAATFAFRKCFLKNNSFNNDKLFGEESSFLKNFTVPLVKLDPSKTILVFSHSLNTIDKRFIFKNEKHHKVRESEKEINDIVKSDIFLDFIVNNDKYVQDYEFGKREFKKDIIEKIEEIEEKNSKKMTIVDSMKENLSKYTKDELINIILNLKLKKFIDQKKQNDSYQSEEL